MRNLAVVNPPHVVDIATFEPAMTPTNNRGVMSDQELEDGTDPSLPDLSIVTPRETTLTDRWISTTQRMTDDNLHLQGYRVKRQVMVLLTRY